MLVLKCLCRVHKVLCYTSYHDIVPKAVVNLVPTTLLVAPHIIVAHGLIYTLSNCMRHERAKQL